MTGYWNTPACIAPLSDGYERDNSDLILKLSAALAKRKLYRANPLASPVKRWHGSSNKLEVCVMLKSLSLGEWVVIGGILYVCAVFCIIRMFQVGGPV